jgi:RNA polymerase sigma-70 factor (ECF subfamily)
MWEEAPCPKKWRSQGKPPVSWRYACGNSKQASKVTPRKAFDQYHQAVYSFAYRLTGRPDLAEDITQECFLSLLRAPERYDPSRGSMKVYLFAIARNLALKQYRDYGAELPIDGAEELLVNDPRGSLDISSAVAGAIASLPQPQQEALILFEYEGVTLEEITLSRTAPDFGPTGVDAWR